MSVLENRKTVRCACAHSHTHFPRLFSVEISYSVGQEPGRAPGLPWPRPRLYCALDTVSRVPRRPRGKEELRRMLRGGEKLAAGSPTCLQYFEICRLLGTSLFSSDASQTSQNTKIYPGLYKLYPTRRNHWEKKSPALLLTYVFNYIFKISNSH